jgi:flagellar basal body rod protein FlgC
LAGDITGMNVALLRELQDGIEADRAYQRALTSELEAMRQETRRTFPPSAPPGL